MSCYSIKGDLAAQCEHASIPTLYDLEQLGLTASEDLDLVVVVVGSNDLYYHSAEHILWHLRELKRLLCSRGLEVMMCSLFLGTREKRECPWLEQRRQAVNRKLLKEDGVIDCDGLFANFPSELWKNSFHLKREGYREFGRRLAGHVAKRFGRPTRYHVRNKAKGNRGKPGKMVHVFPGSKGFVPSILAGSYEKVSKRNHGRPVYKKISFPGTPQVMLFFWDARDGEHWSGWWFGPNMRFEHPAWAFNPSVSWEVPREGWRTISSQGGNESVQLFVSDEADVPDELTRRASCDGEKTAPLSAVVSAPKRRIVHSEAYWAKKARTSQEASR